MLSIGNYFKVFYQRKTGGNGTLYVHVKMYCAMQCNVDTEIRNYLFRENHPDVKLIDYIQNCEKWEYEISERNRFEFDTR